MTVSISTVYALDMPKYVYIQLYAGSAGVTVPPPLKARADTFEVDERANKMVLKLHNSKVGEFNANLVLGWWIEDTDV